jgi:very-short-patch-repair endonuclease
MNLIQKLNRLGGVATRRDLVRATSRKEFDGAVKRREIVRDAHGRYAVPVAADALRAANGLSGVVSHRTAALHWGWELKTVPEQPDVTIRRKRHLDERQADGVTLHWADLKPGDLDGPVTSRERTLVDCVRSLPFDEALTVADSALRHRALTKSRLIELADSIRGPGARQARRVAREATDLAANPFESVLRAIALDVAGLDLRPQVVIADRSGRGRADLVDRDRRWVVEAESHSWHSKRGALRRDCRRYTKLVLLGWRVLRFAWEDVMFHPGYVRDCLVEAAAVVVPQQAECTCGARAAA